MVFAYLSKTTAENVPILNSKSLLIPEPGYSSHTVAFHLIRTERAENCYLQKEREQMIFQLVSTWISPNQNIL